MNNPRRIGIFLDTWDFGGIASFCFNLGQGLQRAGYEVTLLLGRKCKPHDAAASAALRQLLQEKNFAVLDLQLSRVSRRHQNAYLRREIAALHFELLILNNFSAFLPAFNALAASVRMISIGHGDHSHSYGQFIATQYFVHRHVAISRRILETCAGLCPPAWRDHIVLCHHGVPLPEPGPLRACSGPLRIAYCGRFDFTDKRLQDLPALWKSFIAQDGDGCLTLIGDGEVRDWLRRQFSAEIETGSVLFAGLLQGVELREALAGQQVILSLSNWEGLGMAVIEAALLGCYPVLSDTVSGHREIIRELGGGTLCPVGDTAAFVAALKSCAADRESLLADREKLRRAAAARFNLDLMIERYDAMIRASLAEPLRSPADHLGVPTTEPDLLSRLFPVKPSYL